MPLRTKTLAELSDLTGTSADGAWAELGLPVAAKGLIYRQVKENEAFRYIFTTFSPSTGFRLAREQ